MKRRTVKNHASFLQGTLQIVLYLETVWRFSVGGHSISTTIQLRFW